MSARFGMVTRLDPVRRDSGALSGLDSIERPCFARSCRNSQRRRELGGMESLLPRQILHPEGGNQSERRRIRGVSAERLHPAGEAAASYGVLPREARPN